MAPPAPVDFRVTRGTCHALFAYDVGWAIRLDAVETQLAALAARSRIKRRPRGPQYLEFHPAPLRLSQDTRPVPLAGFSTGALVEVLLYDFGAVSVSYRIPLEGAGFARLLDLSEGLYENPDLLADSRRRVEQLLDTLRGAIERPAAADSVEDYVIFEIEAWEPEGPAAWKGFDQQIARVLRCEREALSDQEVSDALANSISFGPADRALIDWNAAILFGREMEDVRSVLEFANVELLESRVLDGQLDLALDQAYEALAPRWLERLRLPGLSGINLSRVAEIQVDSAVLFERVNNTLKLLGDQYLARVYRLASQRLHLSDWDAAILRKLETLDSIYGKMSDRAAAWRMEALEWIIIILIAVSIAIPFLMGSGH